MRWAILPVTVLLLAAAQDPKKKDSKAPADKTKGLSAPALIGKAAAEMAKLKGFHVEIENRGQQGSAQYEGIVKKDGAAVTGGGEIYAKGSSYLVENGGSYVPPSDLDVQSDAGRAAAAFRNPSLQLSEIFETGRAGGEVAGDESVGDIDCKIVRLSLSRAQKEKVVKEMVAKVKLPIPVGDPMQFIDLDKTTADYKVWIGKTDLRIHKYEFHAKPELKGGLPVPGGGGPMKLEITSTVELLKFDDALEWKIPAAVQSRLGLK
jgi:hypothetical protein